MLIVCIFLFGMNSFLVIGHPRLVESEREVKKEQEGGEREREVEREREREVESAKTEGVKSGDRKVRE